MYSIKNFFNKNGEKNFYKVIEDENELKLFFDKILIPLEEGESYLACYASREKKLSQKERENFGVKRGAMFHTEVLKKHKEEEITFEKFLSFISKFETNSLGYTTNNGSPYPEKSLVLYIYLNPCSELLAAQDTLKYINTINNELISATQKGSQSGIKESILKLSSVTEHIKSCHAQNPSRKIYIDFDLDGENIDLNLLKEITNNYFKDNFFMVKTAGGVHIICKKEGLKFNPKLYVDEVCSKINYKEFKLNTNCMIPVPGTYQYGNYPVKLLF